MTALDDALDSVGALPDEDDAFRQVTLRVELRVSLSDDDSDGFVNFTQAADGVFLDPQKPTALQIDVLTAQLVDDAGDALHAAAQRLAYGR